MTTTSVKEYMRKVKVLKKMSYNGTTYSRGQVVEVSNNDAHGLIEKGLAKLFTGANKMMRPKKRRGYRIK